MKDPTRIEMQNKLGIDNSVSDARLKDFTIEKSLTPEEALRELEMKQKDNGRTPYNDPARAQAQVIERIEDMADKGTGYRAPF
jgi:hypothetical protein